MKGQYADVIEDTRLVKSIVFRIYKVTFLFLSLRKQTNQTNVKKAVAQQGSSQAVKLIWCYIII